MYGETRVSRIRAAMFPESEAGPSSGVPHRATIVEQVCGFDRFLSCTLSNVSPTWQSML